MRVLYLTALSGGKVMIGSRLRERRLAKGLTQAALGQIVGVGKSAISQYESGVREPDSEVLIRLAGCLGVTTDWLLGLDARDDLVVKEPRVAYGSPPMPQTAAWQEYLAELSAQVSAIQSEGDRHAVLEMARFLAQKKIAHSDQGT